MHATASSIKDSCVRTQRDCDCFSSKSGASSSRSSSQVGFVTGLGFEVGARPLGPCWVQKNENVLGQFATLSNLIKPLPPVIPALYDFVVGSCRHAHQHQTPNLPSLLHCCSNCCRLVEARGREKTLLYLVVIRPHLKFRIMPTIHPSEGNEASDGAVLCTRTQKRRYHAAIEHWDPQYAKAKSSAERETIVRKVYSDLVGTGLQFLVEVGGGPQGTRDLELAGEERATKRIKRSLDGRKPDPPHPDVVSSMTDANTGRRSVAGALEDKGSIGEAWSHGTTTTDGGPRRLVTGNEAPAVAGAPFPMLAEVNLFPQGSGFRHMAEVEASEAEEKKRATEAAAPPMGPESCLRRTGAVGTARPSPSSAGVPTAAAVVFVPRNVGVGSSDDRRRSPGVAVPASGPPRVAPAGRRVEGMSHEEEEEGGDGDGVGARADGEGQFQRAVPEGERRALRAQVAAAQNAERGAMRARMAAHDTGRRALRAQVAAHEGALRAKDDMIRAKDDMIRAKDAVIRANDDMIRAAQGELRALRELVSTLWRGEERREAPSG
jgi:hypothetical protein